MIRFFAILIAGLMSIAPISAGAMQTEQSEKPKIETIYLGYLTPGRMNGVHAIRNGNPKNGRKLVTEVCDDFADMAACYVKAQLLQQGIGGPKDEAAAQSLYSNICWEYGDQAPEACAKVGENVLPTPAWKRDDSGISDKQRATILARIEKRCAAGNQDDCQKINNGPRLVNFGWVSDTHKSARKAVTAKDWTKARKLFDQACEKDADMSACFSLSEMEKYGLGGAKDEDGALARQAAICEDYPRAKINFCAMARAAMGSNAFFQGKDTLARNEIRCTAGDFGSCVNAGAAYGTGNFQIEKDLKKAQALYRKACDGGEGFGCTNLGSMYFSGETGKKDDGSGI